MEYAILLLGFFLVILGVIIVSVQLKIIKEQKEQKKKLSRLKI